MFRIVSICLAVAASGVSGAAGQELNSAAERTAACLKIEDAGERLACFESAATALSEALETPAAPAVQAEIAPPVETAATVPPEPELPKWAEAPEVKPEPAQVAAASAQEADEPKTPIWARVIPRREKNTDEIDALNVSVVRILRNAAGRHFFFTADGQEWEQTITETVKPPKSLPAAATIKEAVFGSPFLTFDDGPTGAYKVKRVN